MIGSGAFYTPVRCERRSWDHETVGGEALVLHGMDKAGATQLVHTTVSQENVAAVRVEPPRPPDAGVRR